MKLRPYQQELEDKVRQELISGKKSICVVLGCGGGKSVIQGDISANATKKGNRVLFLVHRKELCEQITNTFKLCGVDFSLCDVSMVQTVTRRLDKIQKPDLIITDEAHHGLSKSYTNIYDYFPDSIRLGFTATPMRMNEGGLGKIYESLITGVSTDWLINNNYLAPYKYYSVKLVNMKGVKVKRGDYDIKQVNNLMQSNVIYGDTVEHYKKIADGKRTIVYCSSIESSKKTVNEFIKNGIVAAHLDGETDKKTRSEVIEKFRSGELTVLSNVDLFGEGFDVPDCECVILLRPTKSLTLFIQQSMRSMRYKDGKTATIIDHVGNIYEHGFPDDVREWSLKAKKSINKNLIHIRECVKCFHVMKVNIRVCPECGYEIIDEKRYELEKIDIELEELKKTDRLKLKPYNYYEKLKTFEQLKEFQKAKKFKFSWVLHKCIELKIEIPSRYDYMLDNFIL